MARSLLATFLIDQLAERHLVPETFAASVGINPSGLYKFLRGDYAEPRQSTLEKIAVGLGYASAADLLVASGQIEAGHDPDEAELVALFRQVPEQDRPAAKSMLRGLAVLPTVSPAKKRRRPSAKSRSGAGEKPLNGAATDSGPGLVPSYFGVLQHSIAGAGRRANQGRSLGLANA